MIVTNQRLLRCQNLLDAASFWRALRTAPRSLLLVAASGWITLVGTHILPPGSPPRVALVFGFVLTCPGLAISELLPAGEWAERWVLAIALSISCGLLVSVVLTLLRIDSISLRLGSLALITTFAVLVDVRLSSRAFVLPATTVTGKAGS